MIRRDLFGDLDIEARAITHIQTFTPNGVNVANSGGKDSAVIRHLFLKAGVKSDFHHNLTTVDPPELIHHLKKNNPETVIHKPKISMWDLIPSKLMPPTRVVRYCCKTLKESFCPGGIIALGVRWAESHQRSKRCLYETDLKSKKQFYFNPIIDWSEAEVWQYIRKEKIPYCSLYDEGFKRLGCIGCPMQGPSGMKRDFLRWPTYSKSYIRSFDRMLDVRKSRGLDTQWKNGRDVMQWWTSKKAFLGDPDQGVLYEG
jgi:phosphoadenosine phosphosulfate reductase